MKNVLTKTTGVILILIILLSTPIGCVQPDANQGESGNGQEGENNSQNGSTDGETTKLNDILIETLSNYLEDFRVSYDIPGHTFRDKLFLMKTSFTPMLVRYGNECYYAAAYYVPSHSLESERLDYCCHDEYLWVGFENIEDIKEMWNGYNLVAAFQINSPQVCKNIKTDSAEVTIEHFTMLDIKFWGDAITVSKVHFDNFFIYITDKEDSLFYYSSDVAYHESWSIECIEIEGEYYIKEYFSTRQDDGDYYEEDILINYGEYYNELIENLYDYYSENIGSSVITYSLFKLDDIVKIIK